ncbi:MAG: hypothetical protein UHK60_08070 [Acutalibacteraceae bacterium]|nr:hypothetical protein [Acutalibacteraceae bacterium]
MKEKTSVTSSLSNKGTLTDAEINAGFDFNTILTSPNLNGQLYDIDSQVDIISKEICNFLIGNGVTINSGDNSQLATLMSSLLSAKQNTLVAGNGITIDENGVISAQSSTPANIPLFYCAWLDSLPFNTSWVNANNYSWLYGSTYVGAYNRLNSQLNPVGTFRAGDTYYVCNFSDGSMQTTTVLVNSATVAQLESWCSSQGYTYSGASIEEFKCYKTVSASSETIEGITITYYQTNDGKKIVTSDAEIANAESIYNATGVQWYYILDTVNQRFKLPRTKWGFTGVRDKAGNYISESLPNIIGSVNILADTPNTIATGSLYIDNTQVSSDNRRIDSVTTGSNKGLYIDASLSSSAYRDNAPVQQRATQMYLYFYLGSTDVEEIAEIAGIKAETINSKADTDLRNITATAKTNIRELFKYDTANPISISNGTTLTKGGMLMVRGSGTNMSIQVYVNGAYTWRLANAGAQTTDVGNMFLVFAGDVITTAVSNATAVNMQLYPFLGE